MSRLTIRRTATAILSAAALGAGALGAASVAQAGPYDDPTTSLPRKTGKIPGVGPRSPYVQEIQIDTVIPLKNRAIINPTKYGYLFRAGQQDTHLTMSLADGRLRFVDTGTGSWEWLPDSCRKLSVPKGIGASCAIPSTYGASKPMLIEVWPRLGDDVVDSRDLPSRFDVSFLGDKGDDVARFGAGYDFFNGAQEHDKGYGGAGRDWIRTGIGNDAIYGQGGADHLVGVHDHDVLYGGGGDDRIEGGGGGDQLTGGAGVDYQGCGAGRDKAWISGGERANQCETVVRS